MLGIFPMSDSRNSEKTYFVNPEQRGVIPIKEFHVSKSLLRLIRKRPFKITLNNAFPEVIKSCATINRTDTWINNEIETLFVQLNKQHYAHSIECWKDDKLVGGIYGIAIGGVYFAESMFSSVSNASKIALVNLVARLWKTGFQLLDVQFLNDHLIQFGAYQIKKTDFKQKLEIAMKIKANLYSIGSTDEDFFDCLSEFLQTNTEMS
ncbi:MAG: leucyl/phenylalanyl-tRNA--protein transferase [SAR116 cluster bacterium]|nr:leucyl/phenylalanyl-tRNA--protein transferase [SAR116 cluster bacterium]